MSTQKGNVKKKGQKYQNEFAFKHNKNSMKTRKILEAPLDLLCERCLAIMEWKIKYRKYKPLTTPSKCNVCENKTIFKGHRTACDKCANELKVCSKCLEPCEKYGIPSKPSKHLRQKKDKTFDEILSVLKERQKRTIQRRTQDGEDIIFDGTKGIINKDTGEIIFGLKDINGGVLYEGDSNDLEDSNAEMSEEEDNANDEENHLDSKKKDKDVVCDKDEIGEKEKLEVGNEGLNEKTDAN